MIYYDYLVIYTCRIYPTESYLSLVLENDSGIKEEAPSHACVRETGLSVTYTPHTAVVHRSTRAVFYFVSVFFFFF